jgi:Family of unknown function (DUF6144)
MLGWLTRRSCLGKTEKHGMLQALEANITQFAGEPASRKIMNGSEGLTAKTDKKKMAKWVKGAMERFDSQIDDEKIRTRIMENCGHECAKVNGRVIERAKVRRRKFKSDDAFLEAEQQKPMTGTRLVREGNVLNQYYTPKTFTRPMRCYCSLLRGLPEEEKVSITYCNCSKGFVETLWESVLGRPVKVELVQSVISGADECEFKIHI